MTEQSLRYIQINSVAYAVNTPARDAATEKANLFYDYVFAPESGQQQLPAITVQYVMQGNPTVNTSTIPANMPVERNKRTNISGNLIINTSATSLSVELDDAKKFISPKFCFLLQEASQKGIDIDAQVLQNQYDKFVMLVYQEDAAVCFGTSKTARLKNGLFSSTR
ncbi:hypothetical protein FACS189426_20020 [Bacteroidia bacterium]|nr:hypothetical protein FACS189426_20020 [Bacteroidia bacterium]